MSILNWSKRSSQHYLAVPTKEYYNYVKYLDNIISKIDDSFRLNNSFSFDKFDSLYKWKKDKNNIVKNEIEKYKIENKSAIEAFNKERENVRLDLKWYNKSEYKKTIREHVRKAIDEVRSNKNDLH